MTATLPGEAQTAPSVRKTSTPQCLQEGSFERGEWITQAKCRGGDPDALFVRGAEQRKAAVICRHCPVVMECRADALDNKVEFGVWGGLTERQRRALLRKNPQITSWAIYLSEGGELTGI